MTDKETLRQHIAKTVQLTDEQFDYFFSFFKPVSFKKKDKIINVGDDVDLEYFVLSGCLKTFFTNDDDKINFLNFPPKFGGLHIKIKLTKKKKRQ
ncbi:MAG: hypothetical protein RR391_00010 [Chryseobacterium sp.]